MLAVSIDIETTGLTPGHHQVIEFGAKVFDTADPRTPVGDLPTFHAYLLYEEVVTDPFVAAMHEGLWAVLRDREDPANPSALFIDPQDLGPEFATFLLSNGFDTARLGEPVRLYVTGKNVGAFDLQHLLKVPSFPEFVVIRSRTLDPGTLYFDPICDEDIPSLSECKRRAGMDPHVAHTAVADAEDVVELLRVRWKELGLYPAWVKAST